MQGSVKKQLRILTETHLTVNSLVGPDSNYEFNRLPEYILHLEERHEKENHKTERSILETKTELYNLFDKRIKDNKKQTDTFINETEEKIGGLMQKHGVFNSQLIK